MSWTLDIQGNLVNLDRVETIAILEVEENDEAYTHCLQAQYEAGNMDSAATLKQGSESECLSALAAIVNKVHMIRT